VGEVLNRASIAVMTGTLFVVGTPIGNLRDLSDRARETLARVDVVAAEDTRRTGRLLRAFTDASPRLVSFFAGNESQRVPSLVAMMRDDLDVALVTDAGMPGISDPGYALVAACVEEGIFVDVVPGPSAVLTALVISGLPSERFVFEGFLPRSGRARAQRLEALADEPRTIVLFESPRRVAATLADLLRVCGDRRAVVARELTKLHQEVLRGSLSDVLDVVAPRDLKGEVVVVLDGADAAGPSGTMADALEAARDAIRRGARPREAAKSASAATGLPVREIYAALVGDAGPRG
jgi:16S rRNA (cytidine1402-2'-O)-methyltransferase